MANDLGVNLHASSNAYGMEIVHNPFQSSALGPYTQSIEELRTLLESCALEPHKFTIADTSLDEFDGKQARYWIILNSHVVPPCIAWGPFDLLTSKLEMINGNAFVKLGNGRFCEIDGDGLVCLDRLCDENLWVVTQPKEGVYAPLDVTELQTLMGYDDAVEESQVHLSNEVVGVEVAIEIDQEEAFHDNDISNEVDIGTAFREPQLQYVNPPQNCGSKAMWDEELSPVSVLTCASEFASTSTYEVVSPTPASASRSQAFRADPIACSQRNLVVVTNASDNKNVAPQGMEVENDNVAVEGGRENITNPCNGNPRKRKAPSSKVYHGVVRRQGQTKCYVAYFTPKGLPQFNKRFLTLGEFPLDSEAWKAFNIFALVHEGRESCKHIEGEDIDFLEVEIDLMGWSNIPRVDLIAQLRLKGRGFEIDPDLPKGTPKYRNVKMRKNKRQNDVARFKWFCDVPLVKTIESTSTYDTAENAAIKADELLFKKDQLMAWTNFNPTNYMTEEEKEKHDKTWIPLDDNPRRYLSTTNR